MRAVDLYENEFLVDQDKILIWMEKSFQDFDSKLLEIESDGLVYNGYLYLARSTKKLKVQFKEVTGSFLFAHTPITSLEGYPQIVGGNISCSYTNITSLKFCPKSVIGWFSCRSIKITDPKEYRYALYSEMGGIFESSNEEVNKIINAYSGSANRRYWPKAINLLSKVKL